MNWGGLMHPELATPGTRVVNQYLLGRALTGEMALDPPINALMVYNSNPMVVCPEQDKIAAGLAREDLFTVVSDHFLTDTARYADIVLPATTQLEQHDIMFSWGHFYVTLNTPAVAPLGEAVPNTELFRRLAARMGFTEPCFTRTDEEMLAEAFDWSAPAMEGITVDSLRETGWARLNLPVGRRVRPARRGRLPDAVGQDRVPLVGRRGRRATSWCRCSGRVPTSSSPAASVDPLPHYVPPRETADTGYRLNLISPKSHAYLNSSAGDQPAQRRVQGEQTVIDPPAGRRRARHRRRAVRAGVQRPRPVRRARQVTRRDRPRRGDVADGRVAEERQGPGATVNAVNPFAFADLGNAPTFSDTRVEVEVV